MPISSLDTPEAVEDALRAPRLVLLKHSTRCPVSSWAWEQIQALHGAHPELEIAWIDVVGERTLSRDVAEHTGIPHESPQVIVILDGRVVHHASHMDVQRTEIEEVLALSS